ncbi:uncharacterized protein LOC116964942 isoform X2 [Tyto alba]|uniref:uncharacterized protein LOC116964942 isoform X2 n=1 Tax=Tyto alba TaxID=56313 RepID=UPI001C6701C2|nr:uncharacterized protein LOC116964942 isoform X2 [Tyto alba]
MVGQQVPEETPGILRGLLAWGSSPPISLLPGRGQQSPLAACALPPSSPCPLLKQLPLPLLPAHLYAEQLHGSLGSLSPVGEGRDRHPAAAPAPGGTDPPPSTPSIPGVGAQAMGRLLLLPLPSWDGSHQEEPCSQETLIFVVSTPYPWMAASSQLRVGNHTVWFGGCRAACPSQECSPNQLPQHHATNSTMMAIFPIGKFLCL